MFISSIFRPYFHIHGEYFLDTPDDNSTTWFGTGVHNSYAEPISLILLGLYLLIANVLLLNLVIAIFNSTYENILGSSLQWWRFNRYEIVVEYAYRRSVLFPPFSLLVHLFQLLRYLCCCCCRCCGRRVKQNECTETARAFAGLSEKKLQDVRELEGSALIRLVRRREKDSEEVEGVDDFIKDDIEQLSSTFVEQNESVHVVVKEQVEIRESMKKSEDKQAEIRDSMKKSEDKQAEIQESIKMCQESARESKEQQAEMQELIKMCQETARESKEKQDEILDLLKRLLNQKADEQKKET